MLLLRRELLDHYLGAVSFHILQFVERRRYVAGGCERVVDNSIRRIFQ